MRIRRDYRRWGRLALRLFIFVIWFGLIFGCFGVIRVNNGELAPDIMDGDLVFYERFSTPNLEDKVVWSNGDIGEWSGSGDIIGRVVLLWRGRGI